MRIYLINHIIEGVKYSAEIKAISTKDAEEKAKKIGLDIDYNHLCPVGRLLKTIPTKRNSFQPDWKNQIDHEKIEQN